MSDLEEFELEGARGLPIRGEVRRVAQRESAARQPAKGGIVMLHGFKGFARWGFFPYLANRFVDAGFNVVTFDLSGSGVGANRESFTEPDAFANDTFSAELTDVNVVMAAAAERGWLAPRAGLFGFSRGGGLAVLHAARDPTVKALVTWSAIATVERWSQEEIAAWRQRGFAEVQNARTGDVMRVSTAILDDVRDHAANELDIPGAAERVTIPWLVVHGTADETVGVHEGRQLHTASNDRAELVLVEGASHTYQSKHGLTRPTPELAQATDRTVRFYAANLGTS